jgi:hypothetical protein
VYAKTYLRAFGADCPATYVAVTLTRMPLVIAFDTARYLITRESPSKPGLFDAGKSDLLARPAETALAARKDLESVDEVVIREVGP